MLNSLGRHHTDKYKEKRKKNISKTRGATATTDEDQGVEGLAGKTGSMGMKL